MDLRNHLFNFLAFHLHTLGLRMSKGVALGTRGTEQDLGSGLSLLLGGPSL